MDDHWREALKRRCFPPDAKRYPCMVILVIVKTRYKNGAPRTRLQELRRRICAAIYGWDRPLLTFIYPCFEQVAHLSFGDLEMQGDHLLVQTSTQNRVNPKGRIGSICCGNWLDLWNLPSCGSVTHPQKESGLPTPSDRHMEQPVEQTNGSTDSVCRL